MSTLIVAILTAIFSIVRLTDPTLWSTVGTRCPLHRPSVVTSHSSSNPSHAHAHRTHLRTYVRTTTAAVLAIAPVLRGVRLLWQYGSVKLTSSGRPSLAPSSPGLSRKEAQSSARTPVRTRIHASNGSLTKSSITRYSGSVTSSSGWWSAAVHAQVLCGQRKKPQPCRSRRQWSSFR